MSTTLGFVLTFLATVLAVLPSHPLLNLGLLLLGLFLIYHG